MREDLAQQHQQNEQILKDCQRQRRAMGFQRATVWQTIEHSLECVVKAQDLAEKATRLREDSRKLRDRIKADLERQVGLRKSVKVHASENK